MRGLLLLGSTGGREEAPGGPGGDLGALAYRAGRVCTTGTADTAGTSGTEGSELTTTHKFSIQLLQAPSP